MRRIFATIFTFLSVFVFGASLAPAQISIKLPDINIKKPDVKKPDVKKPDTNTKNTTNTTNTTTQVTNNKTVGSKLVYDNQRPNNVPVLMKNTIHVKIAMSEEYWKMKGQRNYTSWVPLMRFSHFYNNEKALNYTVEYFNPDGSPWFSETLEQSNYPAGDRTILFQSPSPWANGAFDTKATAGTGMYSFKITDQATKAVLIQGKFKVGKFSRAYSAAEKNKNAFYVDYDWLLPFGSVGFHYSGMEIGGIPLYADFWIKGKVELNELEGRIFYKGQQIASTKEGGVGGVEDREGEYAFAFDQPYIWRRYRFQWRNFLLDNNGTFNRETYRQDYPNAHYFDKNPGEYTVKVFRNGTQIREMSFTVGADGRIVQPAYTSEIPLPYHWLYFPTKVMGTEKWDTAGWKTNAFYGNPLNGFAIQ
jgi:hypothetical protein